MKFAFSLAAAVLFAGLASQANAQANYDAGLPRSTCGSPAATCDAGATYRPAPIAVDPMTTQTTRETPRRRKRS